MFQKYKKFNKILVNKKTLCYNQMLEKTNEIFNLDPLNKLLNTMIEIHEILEFEKIKLIEFIYFNRKKIEEILYENEELIRFNEDFVKDDHISNYFYLSLLIRDNPTIINYVYNLDFISYINKHIKIDNKKLIKNLLIRKIIYELINNYKNSDDYDESKEEKILKGIEEENLNLISNNLNIFENFNLNFTLREFLSEKIDSIYIKIIIYLIINKKFDDYKYINDLFEELDLKFIKITKYMFYELNKALTNVNNIIISNNYNMKNPKDLLDEKKINFYYLLFKYILKDSIYIYYNYFLYGIRVNLINILKNGSLYLKDEVEYKNKLEFIINSFDLNYYYYKIDKNNNVENPHLKETQNQSTYNSQNKEQYQKQITDKTETKEEDPEEYNNEQYNKYSQTEYSEFIKKIFNQSSFLLKNDIHNNVTISILNDDEKTSKKILKKFTTNKKIKNDFDFLFLNFKKFLEFLYNVKEKIKKEFLSNYNLIIKLNFNIEDNNNSNSIYNITCKYYFYPPGKERISSFQDENILINGIDGVSQGIYYLINEINDYDDDKYRYNSTKDIYKIIEEKDNIENEFYKTKEQSKKIISILDIIKPNIISGYKVIDFIKIIGNHSNSVEFLKKLNNGYYITGGNKKLFIYDQDYNKKEINLSYNPIGICEINNDNKNVLKFVSYSYENFNYITYEIKKSNVSIKSHKYPSNHIIQINENSFIISNIKGTYLCNDLLNFDKNSLDKILRYSFFEGIKIKEGIVAFTSNKIMPNGNDRLVYFNLKLKKIIYELEGYSFSINKNSLLLLNNTKANRDKILICACTKYTQFQQNGIVFLNTKYETSQDIYNSFVGTQNFQPFCLAQINLVDISTTEKNEKIYSTNYFFVGGFDEEKGRGAIKLYKINLNYRPDNVTIECVDDIILENEEKKFYGFKGPVTSIVQSFDTGEFLISCSDGNVYRFSPANINYFLFYDEEENSDLDYEEIKFYDEKIQKEIDKINLKKKIDNKKMFDILLNDIKQKIPFNLDFLR